jgi:hypothetical protein
MDHARVRNGSILRVLRGTRLSCGCVVGIYETYAGTTVAIVDEPHPDCRLAHHGNGCMTNGEEGAVSWQETLTS